MRMRYYLTIMARILTTPLKEPLKVSSVKLTATAEGILQQLSQDASDRLGWTVTSSAVVRALVSYAGQQPASWVSSALQPLIEQEITQGRVWGSKKKQ
jgi:hypothetical protein